MKTPYWESSGGATQALLSTKSFVFCTLYTFILANSGPTIRLTTSDIDITANSTTWLHDAPPIELQGTTQRAHWKAGVDVDTWQVTVIPRLVHPVTGAATPDTIGNVPWIQAASAGALDGAQVQVDRAFLADWPNPGTAASVTGLVTGFYGKVAGVDVGRTTVTITMNSFLETLNTNAPFEVFQGGCRHTLFDIGCTLTKSTFKKSSSVTAVTANNVFTSTIATPSGSATFTLGTVTMTSGNNSGFTRSVRKWAVGSPSTFTLMSPFPFAMTAGDTFDAYPGCDKTVATCTLFSNLVNFGGQPYIPAMETAI